MMKIIRFPFVSLFFGVAAALITYWQTTRMTHLVDYSYQVEISYRMYLGQVPYRDFMLVLTPGVYSIMAGIMHLTGGYSHAWVVFHSMMVATLTSVVSFFVFWRICKDRWLTLFFSLALLVVGQAIYPYPIYDIWAVLCMLLAILCWTFLTDTRVATRVGFFLGVFAAGSFLFKQTIGLSFAVAVLFSMVAIMFIERTKKWKAAAIAVMLGEGLIFGLFGLWLWQQNVLGPFIDQVIIFPQAARDIGITLGVLLSDYQKALFFLAPMAIGMVLFVCCYRLIPRMSGQTTIGILFLIWSFILTQFVLAFPSMVRVGITVIWTAVMLTVALSCFMILRESVRQKRRIIDFFLPLILLVTIHVGFLSQSVAGSAYGMWPILFTLVSLSFVPLTALMPRFPLRIFVGSASIAVTLCMGWYAFSNEFTQYVNLKGPVSSASTGSIAGLSAPGPWVGAISTLITDAGKRIPSGDGIAFLPGDDPFFAATNRVPTLRCSQWNSGTCDTFGFDLEREIRDKQISWIIIKDPVMTPHAYPLLGWIPIDMGYRLEAEVGGIYKIYHLSTL